MHRLATAMVLTALGLGAAAQTARSEIPLGPEVRVNTYTTGSQWSPAIAPAADGGFLVVWSSDGQDGSEYGIFGRRYDASDAAVGAAEFRVNAYTTDMQIRPRVASSGDRFVVAWSGYQSGYPFSPDVYARVFDFGTGLAGAELRANAHTYDAQQFPDVAVDGSGNFVVAWGDGSPYYPLTDSFGIVAQRFDANGAGLDPEFQVNSYETGRQYWPRTAMDGGGNFVVAWLNAGNGAYDVHARRFFAHGEAMGPEFRVNSYTTGVQYNPAVASAPDGRFVVVWAHYQTGINSDVRAQVYDAAGTPVGGEIKVNTNTSVRANRPQVAMNAQGQFLVVWDDEWLGGDVWGQKFDALGGRRGAEFRLNDQTAGNQSEPQVVVAADGNFVTAWSSQAGEPDSGIRARRFSPAVDHIFGDDFESGTLGAWSTSSTDGGDLAPSIFGAMKSTQVGLRGLVDDTVGLFVEDATPQAERRYRARFWIDPNGFDPGEALNQRRTRTFIAFSGSPTRRVAAVVLRRVSGVYALMGRARLDDNAQADTPFFNITDAPHAVEIDLQAASAPGANDGSLELWVDGVSVGRREGLDNDLTAVDFARLGALSVKSGAQGTLYWDEFVSRRGTYIGP